MDPLDQTSNGSNNATNNIPEPVVGRNLFPAGSIQTPMVSATNNMPPPVSGSVLIVLYKLGVKVGVTCVT